MIAAWLAVISIACTQVMLLICSVLNRGAVAV